MSEVTLKVSAPIALIEIDNPPVNALSHAVRYGITESLSQALNDENVEAIVIAGRGRTFIAGADIREFGKPPQEPLLPSVVNAIEASPKPVIVAIHGTTLGGGLEVALGGHYRIANNATRMGLPEVTLGLLPGAGGTQRLPRLVPVERAITMITKGEQISADEALKIGLIDEITDETDMSQAGSRFAQQLLVQDKGSRPVRDLPLPKLHPETFDEARKKVTKAARGQISPLAGLQAIEGAFAYSFDEGLANERKLFMNMMKSDQRTALIHAFFAERQVSKLPELNGVHVRDVAKIGIVGGGTMGSGIAASCLLADLPVTLIERDETAAKGAQETVSKLLTSSMKRGKLSTSAFDQIMAEKFATAWNYNAIADCDVVIEAVFESMDVKRDVFTHLDQVLKQGAVLATNTSYLDVNDIATLTARPHDVIGLHFFSPAHVMKLLEIVVGEKSAPDVVATGFALAKKLKKVPVRAGVCDGFIGNRIMTHYRKAAEGAVLAGANPADVDAALVGFGLAMGPFAVSDLAGLDIAWANRKRLAPTRDPREVYATFADTLCEAGHFGRKTGRGFYVYSDGSSTPNPDLPAIIEADRASKGIIARHVGADEIIDRYMAAMVNEAAQVIEEGIARRPLDVDITLLHGYGFPRWRGGPMHYADTVGLSKILDDIRKFAEEDPYFWQPAALLERLVEKGEAFSNLNE